MIPLFRPSYDNREAAAVARVLASGWTGLGPEVERFEQAFAARLGVKHAVATSSCTAALHLAYALHGVGPGDEVIVPTMTFCSTAHAARYCGATPVFADVDADTLLMKHQSVHVRSLKTKLLVSVLYAGQSYEYSYSHVPVVYDCAHAMGSSFDAHGKVCCWSFHAVKNLACGEGGMLTTDDDAMAARARRLRWLGIDKTTYDRNKGGKYSWDYTVKEIGFKSHMSDVAAAIGLVQLAKLDEMQSRRHKIAVQYIHELLATPLELPNSSPSSWHLFVIRTDDRDSLAAHLREHGITTGVHYRPLHLHECYGPQPSLPVAEREWKRLLTLPLYPDLAEADVLRICETIRRYFRGA